MDNCVCCGVQWISRPPTRYNTGAKSIPMIYGMQLLSEFGLKRIKLYFCDKHENTGLRHVIRYVNGTGVLQVRNVITNRWYDAEKIGVVV